MGTFCPAVQKFLEDYQTVIWTCLPAWPIIDNLLTVHNYLNDPSVFFQSIAARIITILAAKSKRTKTNQNNKKPKPNKNQTEPTQEDT